MPLTFCTFICGSKRPTISIRPLFAPLVITTGRGCRDGSPIRRFGAFDQSHRTLLGVQQGPDWDRSLLVGNHDKHGGLFSHRQCPEAIPSSLVSLTSLRLFGIGQEPVKASIPSELGVLSGLLPTLLGPSTPSMTTESSRLIENEQTQRHKIRQTCKRR
jgi:hypothetical protein